jgi:hypothetical protein
LNKNLRDAVNLLATPLPPFFSPPLSKQNNTHNKTLLLQQGKFLLVPKYALLLSKKKKRQTQKGKLMPKLKSSPLLFKQTQERTLLDKIKHGQKTYQWLASITNIYSNCDGD